MAENEIYSLDFDASKFLAGIEQGVAGLNKLEKGTTEYTQALLELQKTVVKTSFQKPVAEINDLRGALDNFKASGGKIDLSKVNGSIDEFMKNGNQMKAFLADLKKMLSTLTDKTDIQKLNGLIKTVEQNLAVLEGTASETATGITALFDKLGQNIQSVRFSDKLRSEFDKALIAGTNDMEALTGVVKALQNELETLDPNSQEFSTLNEYVNEATASMTKLKEEAAQTEEAGFTPLRKRIKDLKVAMQEMEDQGLDNTELFQKMQMESARLTDQLGDQSERIRVLASDTFAMDATVDTLQNVAAGWQVMEGAQALFGQGNEEVQKSMQRLMAVMNIAQGLQQINAFLTGQSAGKLALLNMWTKAQAMAQTLLTKATGTTIGAMKGLQTAIAATGVGVLVVGIGYLVSALSDLTDNTEEFEKAQKDVNDALEKNALLLDLDTAALKRNNDIKISQLKLAGASEETIRKATIKGEQDLIDLRKKTLEENKKIYNKSLAEGKITGDEVKKQGENLLKEESSIKDAEAKLVVDNNNKIADSNNKKKDNQKKSNEEYLKLLEDFNKRVAELQNKREDVFSEQGNTSEKKIRDRYARELQVEIDENNSKYKKLGKERLKIINDLSTSINEVQAFNEIAAFRKANNEALDTIVKDIQSVQDEITSARIDALQEGAAKEQAVIENSYQDRIKSAKDTLEAQQKTISEAILSGLDEGLAQVQLDKAYQLYFDSLEVALESRTKSINKVAADVIEKGFANLQYYNKQFLDAQDVNNEEQIASLSKQYTAGEISYSQYQEELLKIQKEYAEKRLKEVISGAEKELAAAQDQLFKATTVEGKRAAEERVLAARKTIAEAEKGLAGLKAETEAKDGLDAILKNLFNIDPNSETNKAIRSYLSALETVGEQIKANAQAEVEAADIAIQAQQKRVDEATKIAEEGNAEYLQQEEDRLKELEIKREAAARKQLAIDAALQASQVIVAVAGAAAQISKGGPANVAAGIASILAALASGAAIVRSLQANQPKFYEGTDYVSRGKNPKGRDTIPAWLHEGEAVIQADKNAQYSPTIKAIRRGLLPANVLNEFVNNYSKGINYSAIGKAVEHKQMFNEGHFIEMNKRLGRLERSMSSTAEAIGGLKVNVNMDSDGFSAAIQTHINKRNRILNA